MGWQSAPQFLTGMTLLALLTSPAGHAVSRITLLAPAESEIYGEFAQSFRLQLEGLCSQRPDRPVCAQARSVEFRILGELEAGSNDAVDELLISLGSEAGEFLARNSGQEARLLTLIPQITFDRLADCCLDSGNGAVSAVFVEQPVATQLRLVRALFPEARRIGVLLSPASRQDAEDLLRLGREMALELKIGSVTDAAGLGRALGSLLPGVDVLLAVPDPVVYTSDTVASVLLASYRHRVPVVGYSEAMVRAGAAAAVFPDIDHLAKTAAHTVLDFCENGAMPLPGFTPDFSLRVNRDVLRSLGLRAVPEPELRRTLTEMDP